MTLAGRFAKNLKPGDVVFVQGELGAGKTVFVKGVAKAFKVDPHEVSSPTFVLMNHYQGTVPLYHFDLYRLENPEELKTVPLDDFLYGQGISMIEWPQRLQANAAPKIFWQVAMTHKKETQREICISYPSKPQRKILL